jgi:hypothetical protein
MTPDAPDRPATPCGDGTPDRDVTASSAVPVGAFPLSETAAAYALAARYLMHARVHPPEPQPGAADEAYCRGVCRGYQLAALRLLARSRTMAALAAKAAP